jgi:hypothetical protein
MPRATIRLSCFAVMLFATTVANAAQPSEQQSPQDGPDGDGPGGPGGLSGFGGGGEPGYAVTWYPGASVTNQGTELSMVRNRVGMEMPVWSNGADMLMANFSVDQSHYSGSARLPDTLRAFPSDLTNAQVGVQYMHQGANDTSTMLMFDLQSAGDKPFAAGRDISFMLGGFYQKPAKNPRDSWMFGVIYSPLGVMNFPIPLVAYNWNPSDTLHASIGLPMSVNWQPSEQLAIDVSLNPGGADALATYTLSERLQSYGGYQNVSDQYFLSDRIEKEDVFYVMEQRFIVGLRHQLWKDISLDVNAGYAFDRHFGEGDDQQELRDEVSLESGAFVGARFIVEF